MISSFVLKSPFLLSLGILLIDYASCFNHLPSFKIGCFVDINHNRKTDIVVHNDTHVTVYQQVNNKFVEYNTKPIEMPSNSKIKSIAAFDFNYDGDPDLMIMLENQNQNQNSTSNFQAQLWLQSANRHTFDKSHDWFNLQSDQLLILDANSDFRLDVLCKNNDTSNAVGFYVSTSTTSAADTQYNWQPIGENNIILESATIIDLNQDCRSELVYVTTTTNTTTTNYKLKYRTGGNNNYWSINSHELNIDLLADKHNVNKILYADINYDGAVDIIIPSIDDNLVYVYKQKHPNLNSKKLCKSPHKIEFSDVIEMRIPSADGFKLNTNLKHNIVIANVDLDLQIDIILLMIHKQTNQGRIFTATFEDHKLVPKSEQFSNEFKEFHTTAESIAFFHSGEFPQGFRFAIQTATAIKFISYEKLLNDKYFLSVCPLNGKNPDSKSYGAIMPGVTVKAFFHNRQGKEIYLSGDTQWQSSTQQLIFNPFIVFGLNTVDSYIEKLVIGYSKTGDYYFSQPGVPPNSQLFLFPYPMDNPARWKLETFLSPFITVPVLAGIITGVMVILGAMWLYLEIKERKMEQVQKSQASTTTKFFF